MPADAASAGPGEQLRAVCAAWIERLAVGQVWALVPAKWWRVWCRHTGFDDRKVPEGAADLDADALAAELEKLGLAEAASGERPGPIDSAALLADGAAATVRRGLREGEDYVLVPAAVWDLLHGWYGGPGPELKRDVVERGLSREAQVEVFPDVLVLVPLDDKGRPNEAAARGRRCKRGSTIGALLKTLQAEREAADKAAGAAAEAKADDDDGDAADAGELVRLWHLRGVKARKPLPPGAEEGAVREPMKKMLVLRGVELKDPVVPSSGAERRLFVEERARGGEWSREQFKQDFRSFEVGDMVDAKDTVGTWYECVVLEVDEAGRRAYLHYVGWADRWDAWKEFDSADVARHGAHSGGPHRPGAKKAAAASSGSSGRSGGARGYYSSGGGYWGGGGYGANEDGAPKQRGVVGLRNLGNTCFMNSTLQCLSNTPGLTDYFVRERHLDELNRDNPLGWKGRVAEEYGALLAEMWGNEYRVVAPRKFKKTLGEFQPRFSGYAQQDSQELLSFLLDGLHEDLNRVRQKPATQTVESNGRPDAEVAREAWETHLKRNQSVVVDTLGGQLKSRLVCPECDRVSVTFDPFLFVSVPLPQLQDKVQAVTVVFADPAKPLTKVHPMVAKVAHITELKQAISALTGMPTRRMVLADVYKGRVTRVLRDDESVRDIYRDDLIFVYEVPELDTAQAHRVRFVQLVNQMPVPAGRYHADTFGLPLLVPVPSDEPVSAGAFATRARAALAPFVRECGLDGAPFRLLDVDKRDLPGDDDDQEDRDEPLRVDKYRMSIAVEWQAAEAYEEERLKVTDHESVGAAGAAAGGAGGAGGGGNRHELHLGDCLSAFTRAEVLGEHDEWYCSQCKKHQRASKKFDLWKLPDVLVVHLKRFSYSRIHRDKVTTYVDFPVDDLDMSKFCANPEAAGNSHYELYAVSNHMGGMGGGHYTAYARSLTDDQWYLFDDSVTRPVEVSAIKSASAYVLYYARRGSQAAAAAAVSAVAGDREV